MNHQSSYGVEGMHQGEETVGTSFVPPYRSLLQEPTVSLARNPNDRPDVASVAILGYN